MADQRPPALFVGDHLALDFLNSVAAPWGEEIEWLANGADLAAWLAQARAVPEDALARLRAGSGERTLDAAAAEARELRRWFRDFVGQHAGQPLRPPTLRDLAPLNRLLERDEVYRQIGTDDARGGGGQPALRWQRRRRWRDPEALLLPIAEAMGDLVCEQDFALVRKCEASSCSLWFLDVSKGHARRWCSMAVCGNRAKAAAHRARARGPN